MSYINKIHLFNTTVLVLPCEQNLYWKLCGDAGYGLTSLYRRIISNFLNRNIFLDPLVLGTNMTHPVLCKKYNENASETFLKSVF
jgi:hypothetical protein